MHAKHHDDLADLPPPFRKTSVVGTQQPIKSHGNTISLFRMLRRSLNHRKFRTSLISDEVGV